MLSLYDKGIFGAMLLALWLLKKFGEFFSRQEFEARIFPSANRSKPPPRVTGGFSFLEQTDSLIRNLSKKPCPSGRILPDVPCFCFSIFLGDHLSQKGWDFLVMISIFSRSTTRRTNIFHTRVTEWITTCGMLVASHERWMNFRHLSTMKFMCDLDSSSS